MKDEVVQSDGYSRDGVALCHGLEVRVTLRASRDRAQRRRGYLPLTLTTLSLFLFGCGPTKQEREAHRGVHEYFAGHYQQSEQTLTPVAKNPDENFVLNNCRLGSAALAGYDLTGAEDAFLRAYEVINSVGVNDGGRSLGAAVVNEKIKVWKGEPFERAMANFYLGLIYYMNQDYGNARGAFENALFKLRDYTDERDAQHGYREQESNFAVGLIMLGKTWQRLNRPDLAQANFDRARQLRPDLSSLCDAQREAEANLLLIVEFGQGPKKMRDVDGSFVGFAPTPGEAGPMPLPGVSIDGREIELYGLNHPTIDLLAMAQDRRWQDIDTIRAVKDVLGYGLMAGGAGAVVYGTDRHNRNDAATIAGLAAIGAGALLKASSFADTRQWEMLPRTVYLLPLHVSPGTHDVKVHLADQPWMNQTWRGITVPPQGEAAYYVRLSPYSRVARVVSPMAEEGGVGSTASLDDNAAR